MGDAAQLAGDLVAAAREHVVPLAAAAVLAVLLVAAWMVRRAVRAGRPDHWLARLSFLVGFAWSGEAMWEVATQKLHLSPVFAGFAFFLFEAQMAVAMMRAERHQRQHRHPGRHGRAVWLIAAVAGGIAAAAGDSPVEAALRLAVPLLVAHQWWVGLVGDGTVRQADRISWAWTPRRLLVRFGLAAPGARDLVAVDRDRQVQAIATVAYRLHATGSPWRRRRLQTRLRRLAMTADDGMLDDARQRVERAWQAVERTRPLTAHEHAALVDARAAVEAARAEADLAAAAEAEAHAAARAAAAHAEAEAERRVQAEAEAAAARRRAEAEATARVEAEAERRVQAEAAAVRRRAEAEATVRAEAEAEAAAARADAARAGRSNRRRQRRRPVEPTAPPVTFAGRPLPQVPRIAPGTVLRVLQARQEHPDETQKQLAARVQVSDRTVRAVLAATGRASDPART